MTMLLLAGAMMGFSSLAVMGNSMLLNLEVSKLGKAHGSLQLYQHDQSQSFGPPMQQQPQYSHPSKPRPAPHVPDRQTTAV